MSVASTAAKILFGRDLLRLAIESIGLLVLGFAAVVFVILLLLKSLLGFATGSASLGLLPDPGAGAGPLAAIIPWDQLAVMEQVAAASPCAIPWSVLAGVAYVESHFGQNLGPSSAGAYGYAQFMPGTWSAYAGGVPWRTSDPAELAKAPSQRLDSSNFHHELPAMAAYLCTMVGEFGIGRSPDDALRRALFYYNHARSVAYNPNDAYVNDAATRAGR
jgi:hypothetical protein